MSLQSGLVKPEKAMAALSEREGFAIEGSVVTRCDWRLDHDNLTAEERQKLFAAPKGRSTEYNSDNKPMTKIIPKRKLAQSTKSADKFVRETKANLQKMLFNAFEQKQNWKLEELRLKTQQPIEWLKENLKDIAVYIKRGPNKFTYQLTEDGDGGEGASGYAVTEQEV